MQFKKTLLATSALMSAVAWAPQAHAIPAFARQVGMPCSACHYQHFPTLNGFGRSFKAAGFTMVGSEEKIETTDSPGLSIPAVLNLAFVTNLAYVKQNGPTTGTTATTKTTNNGQFQMTQYSLFMGGRVSNNIGFEGEVGLSGGAALASVKMPFSFDVAGGKLGVVPFTTDGLGPQQGFEPLSDGATPVHLFNQQDLAAIGAYEYLTGFNGAGSVNGITAGGAVPANGAALYYYNDMGFVNFTKWQIDSINGNGPGQAPGAAGGGSPTSNYFRLAWTPGDVGGFDTAVGLQYFSGASSSTSTALPGTLAAGFTNGTGAAIAGAPGTFKTRATEVDGQMMGDVSGMPLTLIASYATAPASDPGATLANGGFNAFNPYLGTRKSFNIGGELGVIPNKATLQLGIRRASSGQYVPGSGNVVAGTSGNATDNAIMVGATYSLALNVRAELTYSKYSGDMYNSTASAQAGYMGDSMTVLNLWMGF